MNKFSLFLFCTFFIGYSQTEYQKSVDSLEVLIQKEKLKEKKIKLFLSLCDIYSENNIKELRKCNEKLLNVLKTSYSTHDFGHYYCNKAKISAHNNLNEAIIYANKGKDIFFKTKDWNHYIYATSLVGNFLNANQQSEQGINLLLKTIPFAKKIDSEYLADLYYVLSKLYLSKNDDATSIYFSKRALLCKKPIKNKYQIYHWIANIYLRIGNYKKAIEYNNLDMKYAKSEESKYSCLYRRAHILIKLKKAKEALPILKKCLNYYQNQKSKIDVIDTQWLISICYFELKNFTKAEIYINEVLKNYNNSNFSKNSKNELIDTFINKAEICLNLNKIKESKYYSNSALKLIDRSTSLRLQLMSYNNKINVEKKLKNYKIVSEYQDKLIIIKDSIQKLNNKNKLHQLEVELDVTEKNNQIKNLQIAQLKKQVELNSKNSFLIYISIALFIALLSTFFYFRNNRIIKKKNLLIENEKLFVKKSLQEKETLLKEIHHRVKNNMQLVMSLLSIQAQEKNQNITDFMQVSRSRILSMALIHENLYQSESLSNVNFKTYTENLIQIIKNALNTNHSNIDIQIDINDVYLDVQVAIPLGLIINELVSNAYKYAFPENRNGIIQIQLIHKTRNNQLTIKDNGIGLNTPANAKKTLGLQLVEELVFQIDGQMTILNRNGLEYKIRFDNTNIKTNRYE